MAIFKYFTEEAHALALINAGRMLWKPLSHFHVIEDNGIRGDARDGALEHAPVGGLDVRGLDGEPFVLPIDPQRFVSSAKSDDVFVYCTSNERADHLRNALGGFCVEITDVDKLLGRLRARACKTSKIDYGQIVCGNIDYRSHAEVPLADWAIPEKIVLIKPPTFAWQNEFRFALPKRGAFDVENVILEIQAGEQAPPPDPTQAPIFIEVGSIEEFTRLHDDR